MTKRRITIIAAMMLAGIVALAVVCLTAWPPDWWMLHIPSAILAYAGFLGCIIVNIGLLFCKSWSETLADAFCEIGLAFAATTMISGAIWAHGAWGAPWVWEPRLTGTFLMTLIFLSWRMSRPWLRGRHLGRAPASAALIVLGLPAMALTHLAARWMGGLHPTGMHGFSQINPNILAMCFVAMAAFGSAAFVWRTSFAE